MWPLFGRNLELMEKLGKVEDGALAPLADEFDRKSGRNERA